MHILIKNSFVWLCILIIQNVNAQILSPTLNYGKSTGFIGFPNQAIIKQFEKDASENKYILVYGIGILFDLINPLVEYNGLVSPVREYIVKYNSSNELMWVVPLNVSAKLMTVSNSGEVYISGDFDGTKDFDPTAGISNLTQTGMPTNTNSYICKFTTTGGFLWARALTGFLNRINEMKLDINNQLIICGSIGTGVVDFDFNAGTSNLTGSGGFIACYNSNPDLVWVRFFQSNVSSFDFDNTANIILGLSYSGTIDLNPGAGTVNVNSAGLTDIAIVKLTNLGIYISSFKFGGVGNESIVSVKLDNSNNIFIVGTTQTTAVWDIDAGAGVRNIPIGSYTFFTKYSSTNIFNWANQIGNTATTGTVPVLGKFLELNKTDGTIYMAGDYDSNLTIDFDPSAGTRNLISTNSWNWFIASYTSTGSLVFANGFGINSNVGITYDLLFDLPNNQIFVSCGRDSDADPSTPVVKIEYAVVSYDINGNYLNHLSLNYYNVVATETLGIIPCNSGNLYKIASITFPYIHDYYKGILLTDNHYQYVEGLNKNGNILIVKMDSIGNVLNTKFCLIEDLINARTFFAVDTSENLYISREYDDSFDADPGPGIDSLFANSGIKAIALLKFDSSLVYNWAIGLKLTSNNDISLKDIGISNNEVLISLESAIGATNLNLTPWTTGTLSRIVITVTLENEVLTNSVSDVSQTNFVLPDVAGFYPNIYTVTIDDPSEFYFTKTLVVGNTSAFQPTEEPIQRCCSKLHRNGSGSKHGLYRAIVYQECIKCGYAIGFISIYSFCQCKCLQT